MSLVATQFSHFLVSYYSSLLVEDNVALAGRRQFYNRLTAHQFFLILWQKKIFYSWSHKNAHFFSRGQILIGWSQTNYQGLAGAKISLTSHRQNTIGWPAARTNFHWQTAD
jgi:hypothetical protein